MFTQDTTSSESDYKTLFRSKFRIAPNKPENISWEQYYIDTREELFKEFDEKDREYAQAIFNDDFDAVEKIVKDKGYFLHLTSSTSAENTSVPVWIFAATFGSNATIIGLYNLLGQIEDSSLNKNDIVSETFEQASNNCQLETMKLILDLAKDLIVEDPLHLIFITVDNGHEGILEQLLNFCDKEKRTGLFIALTYNYALSPVSIAAKKEHLGVLKVLYKNANVEERKILMEHLSAFKDKFENQAILDWIENPEKENQSVDNDLNENTNENGASMTR